MNRIAAVVAGLSLAFVGTSTTFADTINVNPGESIQAAINTASSGDVINIAAGTYNERRLNPWGKAITIQGTLNGDGTLATTIDAKQWPGRSGCVFRFDSGEGSGTQIRDLIMYGGGIVCYQSSPTISGCTITGNVIDTPGAGITCSTNSNPNISNCTITDNTAMYSSGGGIDCTNSSPTISGCVITNNTASRGAGISAYYNSNPTISDCLIMDNTATNYGGGIYTWTSPSYNNNSTVNSSPIIIGATLCGNTPNQIVGTFRAGVTDEWGGGPGGSNPNIEFCLPSTGACCLGGMCMIGTEAECLAAGGTYASDDVACADANCATTTPGDVDGDGDVDANDLDSLHASLGICPHDIDHDGVTNIGDLLRFLAGYGATCP